ncbi:SpoIIE family protein phosphatase [Ignavibacterium sp.]|uniref:SpoIIE family protein phosphatase n=1 Tax=Ignavibacterium sp. TaxID=2651167 RepID=UPI00307F78D1
MNKFKAFLLKNKVGFVKLLTVFLAIASITNIYISLKVNVTSNDECLWLGEKINQDSTAYFFRNVKVNGVSYNAGIRDGDQLLQINDYVVRNDQEAQGVLNLVDEGEFADYVVKKQDGSIFKTKVLIKKLISFGTLTFNISALFWLLIGFLVFIAKPEGKQQKLFYLLGVSFVLSTLFNLFPQTAELFQFFNDHPFLSTLLFAASTYGTASLPFVFLYFIWNFFKPIKIAQIRWVRILFIILSVILFLYGVSLLPYIFERSDYVMSKIRSYLTLMSIVSSITNITAGITLLVLFFTEKNKQSRKPILIILLSFVLALVVLIYLSTIAPVLADTIFNSPEYYTPVILLVLVPIIFAYAIFKYHLLDMSVVIMNTVFYSIATASIVAIYFLAVYGLGHSLSGFFGTESQGIIAIFLFTIFAIRFQSTKDKALKFITQKFYPEQFAYENVLVKFSNDISIVVGIDNILNLTIDTFVGSLRIKKFAVLLNENKSGQLILVKQFGFKHTHCELDKNIIQKYIDDNLEIQKYPELSRENFEILFGKKAEILIEEDIYTIVPLLVKSKVIGVLLFGLKYSGSQFSGKDIELLYAAGNQLAIAIENARLYQSEVEKISIEHDLEIARKIQRGLLPACVPYLNGLDICGEMIPAMHVGGDYYDLINLNNKKIFVAVADVSGKGLSASLYMTKLQTITQLYCKDGSSPKEILIEANKILYDSLEPGAFITMTLALFDIEEKTVKICRAGHLPVFMVEGDEVKSIRPKGIALGLDENNLFESNLEEVEFDFKSGQIFSFLSDGFTETMNEKNELFGEEIILELLRKNAHSSSSEIFEKINSEIIKFRQNADQHDDMTMVIVKVKQ